MRINRTVRSRGYGVNPLKERNFVSLAECFCECCERGRAYSDTGAEDVRGRAATATTRGPWANPGGAGARPGIVDQLRQPAGKRPAPDHGVGAAHSCRTVRFTD